MTIEQIKDKLKSKEYDFLRTDKNLGNNIIILTLGGSHAYGMDKEGSDLDVRGIALNSKSDILLGTDFEQVVDVDTDTTMYSFNKMIQLLASSNPNTINCPGPRTASSSQPCSNYPWYAAPASSCRHRAPRLWQRACRPCSAPARPGTQKSRRPYCRRFLRNEPCNGLRYSILRCRYRGRRTWRRGLFRTARSARSSYPSY